MNWPSARSSAASWRQQHDEPRARQLGGAGEVHAERRAPSSSCGRGAKAKLRGCAPAPQLDIAASRPGHPGRRRPARWESRPAARRAGACSSRRRSSPCFTRSFSAAISASSSGDGCSPLPERWPISRDSRLRVAWSSCSRGLQLAAGRIELEHGGGRRRLAAPCQRPIERRQGARAATLRSITAPRPSCPWASRRGLAMPARRPRPPPPPPPSRPAASRTVRTRMIEIS